MRQRAWLEAKVRRKSCSLPAVTLAKYPRFTLLPRHGAPLATESQVEIGARSALVATNSHAVKKDRLMTRGSGGSDWQRSIVLLSGTVIAVVAVTVLYWAQSIFIPVALAIFLTFLLNPVVSRLRLWGIGRTPAVILTVLTAALLLGLAGWVVTAQISSLLRELPEHTTTVKAKVKSLKKHFGGSTRIAQMVEEINREIVGRSHPRTDMPPPTPPMASHRPSRNAQGRGRRARDPGLARPDLPLLDPMMEYLGELALAIILVIFMLQQREEFRNRMIRLVGYGQHRARHEVRR